MYVLMHKITEAGWQRNVSTVLYAINSYATSTLKKRTPEKQVHFQAQRSKKDPTGRTTIKTHMFREGTIAVRRVHIFGIDVRKTKNLYTADIFSTHRRRGDTSVQQNVCWLMQRTVPRGPDTSYEFAGRK